MLFSSVVASRNDYMVPVLPQSYATADGMAIEDTKSFGVGFGFGERQSVQKPSIFQDIQSQLIDNQIKILAALEFLNSLKLRFPNVRRLGSLFGKRLLADWLYYINSH
jgi:hypothetical protein